jgi:hypothetical protein
MSARNWDDEFWAILRDGLDDFSDDPEDDPPESIEDQPARPRVEQDGSTKYRRGEVELPVNQLHYENADPAKYCPTPDRCRAMDEEGKLPVYCSLCDQIATEMMRGTYDPAKYDYLDSDPDPGD